MPTKTGELALECKRQSESCLYTSTSLFYWLRFLQSAKLFFTVTPLVLGAIASWQLLTSSQLPAVKLFIAVCSFLAGVLPSVYSALKYDEHLTLCRQLAGEFKNLQDRFRVAALVTSAKPFKEFEDEVRSLFDRLEKARSHSLVAPELCFWLAKRKIAKGHYDFDVDANREPPAA